MTATDTTDTPAPEVTRDTFGESVEYRDTDGRRHRLDGPAESDYDPTEDVLVHTWYHHGLAHRDDGPAYIYTDRSNALIRRYHHNKSHRLDGPSAIWSAGHVAWRAPGFASSLAEPE